MDLSSFIRRKIIHYLINCFLIVSLTYDVMVTGSPFLRRPVARQFLSSGIISRAKRMRSSHIAGSSSSLVELEGWQELIRGKRSGSGTVLHSDRLEKLVSAIHRLEAEAQRQDNYLLRTESHRGPHQRRNSQVQSNYGPSLAVPAISNEELVQEIKDTLGLGRRDSGHYNWNKWNDNHRHVKDRAEYDYFDRDFEENGY